MKLIIRSWWEQSGKHEQDVASREGAAKGWADGPVLSSRKRENMASICVKMGAEEVRESPATGALARGSHLAQS